MDKIDSLFTRVTGKHTNACFYIKALAEMLSVFRQTLCVHLHLLHLIFLVEYSGCLPCGSVSPFPACPYDVK